MKRHWVIINGLLLLLALFLAYEFWKQWRSYQGQHNPALLNPPAAQTANGGSRSQTNTTPPNYSAIPDNHLFSIERNNVIPEDPAPLAAPKVTAPKPILMGMMGLAGGSYALMVSGNGGESNLYRRLKVGEQLDGYTLVGFLHDRVIMSADGQEIEVRIADQPRRSQPAAQAAAATSPSSRVASLDGAGGQSTARPDPQVPPPDAAEGTVFNGKRKRLVPSPFGMTVVWEDVK